MRLRSLIFLKPGWKASIRSGGGGYNETNLPYLTPFHSLFKRIQGEKIFRYVFFCESTHFNLIQPYLLLTKPHFQTFDAWKIIHLFRLFQAFSDFSSQTLSQPCYGKYTIRRRESIKCMPHPPPPTPFPAGHRYNFVNLMHVNNVQYRNILFRVPHL